MIAAVFLWESAGRFTIREETPQVLPGKTAHNCLHSKAVLTLSQVETPKVSANSCNLSTNMNEKVLEN